MRRHLAAYREAIAAIPRIRLRYTPRSKNLAGIALAKGHAR
jgi:ribonuclease HI